MELINERRDEFSKELINWIGEVKDPTDGECKEWIESKGLEWVGKVRFGECWLLGMNWLDEGIAIEALWNPKDNQNALLRYR